jgi:polygalacturonase
MILTLLSFLGRILPSRVLLGMSLTVMGRHIGMGWAQTAAVRSKSSVLKIAWLGTYSTTRPDHFFVVKNSHNTKITNLNIKNWPVHCFSLTGNQGLTITGLHLDNSDGDAPNSKSGSLAAAHNSDGFDISSSDYVTLDTITVHNQDDCVAVTSGTHITINNMYCYGGHGLSIGSVGGKSNNTVDTVTFSNSQIVNSENGCRIKTNSGIAGLVYGLPPLIVRHRMC